MNGGRESKATEKQDPNSDPQAPSRALLAAAAASSTLSLAFLLFLALFSCHEPSSNPPAHSSIQPPGE